ncbi:hypothetical protein SESBI_01960 [Sesbania bispinosa]|nr:hypothetical protein SESBI_01960 [Sesbania bispinosa]
MGQTTLSGRSCLCGTDNGVRWLGRTIAFRGSAYGLVSVWLKEEVQEVRVHPAEVERDDPVPTKEVWQQVVYEGGPRDTSLLRSYKSHVARRLWSSEDRGTLKVITHGRKLKRPKNDYVRDIVDDSVLGPLVEVGEMTITLDDVNNLLHITVHGRFFFLPSLGKDEAKELLVTLLGVSYSDATAEIEYTRGPSVRLSWLLSGRYRTSILQFNMQSITSRLN